MEDFLWGIIGPGNIAKEFVADFKHVQKTNHKVAAVLSNKYEEAKQFADKENASQVFDKLNDFLENASVNAVYISTPHTLHYKETIACLKKHIPVLCEKPMAVNASQANEMIITSQRNNTFLMEGMWIRFLPSIKKVIWLIENNAIGNVLSINADLSYKVDYEPGNRFFNPELGGGSLLDMGIYPVFLSLLLLGKPDKIDAFAKLSNQQVDENFAALFHYKNGAYAMLQSSIIMNTASSATIYGSKGKLKILKQWNETPEDIIVELYDGSSYSEKCRWEGKGFQYEIEEVYDCIAKGKIYSEKYDHRFSLDLIETLDNIRSIINLTYPADRS